MRLVTKEHPLSLFLKFPETMCLFLDEAFFSVIYYGKNGGRAVPYQEMKLRTKLMISFAAIIVVPLALMLLFVSAYMNMKVRSLEKEYEIELTLPDMINSAQMINESTAKLLEQMKKDTEADPERILDIGYLQDIDNELGGRLSFLVVTLDGEVYYAQNRNNLGELTAGYHAERRVSSQRLHYHDRDRCPAGVSDDDAAAGHGDDSDPSDHGHNPDGMDP